MTMPIHLDHLHLDHPHLDHLSGEALERESEQAKKSLIAKAQRTAILLEGNRDRGLALAVYDLILAVDASDAQAHARRGVILMQQGRLLESPAACEEAARLNPENPSTYIYLAEVLQLCEQPDAAIQAWQKAKKLNPVLTRANQDSIRSLAL